MREWLIAAGTLGAVIVALWIALRQERLARDRRPVLTITSGGIYEEEMRIALEGSVRIPAAFVASAAFMRLAVTNAAGKDAADDVELLLTQIRRPSFERDTEVVEISFPGFGWTHASTTRLTIPPGVTRHVDIALVQEGNSRLELLVNPQPANQRHMLEAGTYELVLTLSARNADAHDYVTRFAFDPDAESPALAIEIIDQPTRRDDWRETLG